MPQEIELKLAFPTAARAAVLRHPLLAAASRVGRAQTLVNTYFDTPEQALSRERIALRTRKAGRQMLQTVKCAAASQGGLSARPEWEQPFRGEFDFSAVDQAPVRAFLEARREQIVPLFATNFKRETLRLTPRPGVSILAMVDTGVVLAGEREEAISELELELETGAAADLLALALELARDLPLLPYDPSKAERGYRLFHGKTVSPRRGGPSPVCPVMDPMQAFRALAYQGLYDWQANAWGAVELETPEFVHQMRVALRRLRTLLYVFADILPAAFVAPWREKFARIADGVGEVRDLDVLRAHIIAPVLASATPDTMPALLARCDQACEGAREHVRSAVQDGHYGVALLEFAQALQALPEGCGGDISVFARDELDNLRKDMKKRLATARATPNAESFHRLRIACKRLRYAMDFFAPLLGGKVSARYLKKLAALQEDLGYANDLTVARSRFAQWLADSAHLGEAVGYVVGWHTASAAALQAAVLERAGALLAADNLPWRKMK